MKYNLSESRNLSSFNIVHETLARLSETQREQLLVKVISDMLSRASRPPMHKSEPLEPSRQLELVCHKAQAMLEPEKAWELADKILRETGIDARRSTRRVNRLRLTLEDFIVY